METLKVFGELLEPWIYVILFKTATTWTGLTGGTHLWTQKYQGKKHPAFDHKWNHPRSAEKRRLLAQSLRNLLLTINNRSIANCVEKAKTLIRQSREIFFSSLDSEFAWQLKLKNKMRWAGDPCENGFDISQTARYKQINWIRWNFSAPAEENRWPDRTVPDHAIQQILRLGIFLGDWKLANIIPIFKKGKRDIEENYRPISLLPVISKVP